jgi:uncharacterized protein (DUF433 family)
MELDKATVEIERIPVTKILYVLQLTQAEYDQLVSLATDNPKVDATQLKEAIKQRAIVIG